MDLRSKTDFKAMHFQGKKNLSNQNILLRDTKLLKIASGKKVIEHLPLIVFILGIFILSVLLINQLEKREKKKNTIHQNLGNASKAVVKGELQH